jgi:hypothetical protein
MDETHMFGGFSSGLYSISLTPSGIYYTLGNKLTLYFFSDHHVVYEGFEMLVTEHNVEKGKSGTSMCFTQMLDVYAHYKRVLHCVEVRA